MARSAENFTKFEIVDDNFGPNFELNACRTDIWLQKRALNLQNRAEMGIFSMKKGLSKKSVTKGVFGPKQG